MIKNILLEALKKSDKFNILAIKEQNSILQFVKDFIIENKGRLSSQFSSEYFHNKYITRGLNIDGVMDIFSRSRIFRFCYEVRCPDCDRLITILPCDTIEQIYECECENDCMDEEGLPVEKRIKKENFKKIYNLNEEFYNI